MRAEPHSFPRLLYFWSALFITALGLFHPNAAFAEDAKTREIQRLLWTLGYGATQLDGILSDDVRTRANKFLADRGKDTSLQDDALLAELSRAFQEKRSAARESLERFRCHRPARAYRHVVRRRSHGGVSRGRSDTCRWM